MSGDEFDFEAHDQQMSAHFSRRTKRGAERIAAISERLAQDHDIKDRGAHLTLVREVLGLPVEYASAPDLNAETWTIPEDLTSWQEARRRLGQLVDGCKKITDVLNARDPVVFQALLLALDSLPYRNLSGLHKAVIELQDVAREASAIRGHSGNRPLPEWQVEAARRCMSFWRCHRRERAVGYFGTTKKPIRGKMDQGTSPSNDFSRWFCAVMGAAAKVPPNTCATLLRIASKAFHGTRSATKHAKASDGRANQGVTRPRSKRQLPK